MFAVPVTAGNAAGKVVAHRQALLSTSLQNNADEIKDRWTTPGQQTDIQKLVGKFNSASAGKQLYFLQELKNEGKHDENALKEWITGKKSSVERKNIDGVKKERNYGKGIGATNHKFAMPIEMSDQVLLYTDGVSEVLANADGCADVPMETAITRTSRGGAQLRRPWFGCRTERRGRAPHDAARPRRRW